MMLPLLRQDCPPFPWEVDETPLVPGLPPARLLAFRVPGPLTRAKVDSKAAKRQPKLLGAHKILRFHGPTPCAERAPPAPVGIPVATSEGESEVLPPPPLDSERALCVPPTPCADTDSASGGGPASQRPPVSPPGAEGGPGAALCSPSGPRQSQALPRSNFCLPPGQRSLAGWLVPRGHESGSAPPALRRRVCSDREPLSVC